MEQKQTKLVLGREIHPFARTENSSILINVRNIAMITSKTSGLEDDCIIIEMVSGTRIEAQEPFDMFITDLINMNDEHDEYD